MAGAGDLPYRVMIERFTRASDGIGGSTNTWAEVATVWAGVTPKSGRESLDEGRTNATYVVVFTLRTRDDLTEADRLVFGGDRYNIRGILRRGPRPIMMEIEAERGVAS